MELLVDLKCVACRAASPRVTEEEIAQYQPQIADWLVAKSRTIGIRAFIGDLVRMAEIEGLGFELVAA